MRILAKNYKIFGTKCLVEDFSEGKLNLPEICVSGGPCPLSLVEEMRFDFSLKAYKGNIHIIARLRKVDCVSSSFKLDWFCLVSYYYIAI